MFQLHQTDFATSINISTYTAWRLFAFDGEVPSCFEDLPFEIKGDLTAVQNASKVWKYLKHSRLHDQLRFEHHSDFHSPGYKCSYHIEGWIYNPDKISGTMDVHGDHRYNSRYNIGALTGGQANSTFITTSNYPHTDKHFIYEYDKPVTIDKFIIAPAHIEASHQCRNLKVEFKDTDGSWKECFNRSVYPHTGGVTFDFPGGPVIASAFKMTILSGYGTSQIQLGQFGLINSDEPIEAEDLVPTWAILMAGEWQWNYAESKYRNTQEWPYIIVSLHPPGVDGEGMRITKAAFKSGDLLGTSSLSIRNTLWESVGPDTEDPVFVAPSTIQLAATDASGTLRNAPQIQEFFDSIKVTDNYDCHITPTNDCPELLPIGDTLITFTATDRSGNEATHSCTITIADMTGPIISIIGDITFTLEAGTPYVDLGATALDNVDGVVTGNISVVGAELVDENTLGIYTVDYNCTDAAGNLTTETRTITVEDTSAPSITAPSNTAFSAIDAAGRPSTEADITAWLSSAVASDNLDAVVNVTHDCPAILPLGDTLVTFSATDSNGNTGIGGATISIEDTTVPVITLVGNSSVSVEFNSIFTDQGHNAYDNVDGDITGNVVVSGIVDTSILGDHILNFDVTDNAGNIAATVQRTVTVEDTTAPVILLEGDANVSINEGDSYVDAGATASDEVDGDVTGNIQVISNVNPNVKGVYQVKYNVADNAGNDAVEVVRTVEVFDVTIPVITLVGDATINLNVDDPYSELGATALDNNDGDITGSVQIASNVNTAVADSYQVTYNVADASGNNAIEVVRTVIVT